MSTYSDMTVSFACNVVQLLLQDSAVFEDINRTSGTDARFQRLRRWLCAILPDQLSTLASVKNSPGALLQPIATE